GVWRLDGNGNDATAQNNGINNGAVPIADHLGISNGAMNFDGVSDYIETSKSMKISPAGAISLWINGLAANQNGENIYPAGYYRFSILGPSGLKVDDRCGIIINGTPSDYYYNWGGQGFFDGQWHNYVISWDDTNLYLYKDGNMTGNPKPHNGRIPVGNRTFILGSAWDKAGYGNFNGSIDEVRLYDRYLSAEEIKNIYEESKLYS
ncbi:MAG: LamG domain-containing protein, partial [Nanoarchaeota archaeon]